MLKCEEAQSYLTNLMEKIPRGVLNRYTFHLLNCMEFSVNLEVYWQNIFDCANDIAQCLLENASSFVCSPNCDCPVLKLKKIISKLEEKVKEQENSSEEDVVDNLNDVWCCYRRFMKSKVEIENMINQHHGIQYH